MIPRQRSRGLPAGPAAVAALVITAATAVLVPGAGAAPALPGSPVGAARLAAEAYARLTPAQRVGQLFMAGVPVTGPTAAERRVLTTYAVGNVFLAGASGAGAQAVAAVTRRLRGATSTARVHPLIATDQEGGEVQRLTGSGFSRMPTALEQGRMSPAALRSAATRWGRQLAAAGVTADLAPVADVVPAAHPRSNQPIGKYDREFGHHPRPVAAHVLAVARGLAAAHVAATVKHFPGLGRASGNTDTRYGVTDPTTRHDAYLLPFRRAIAAGVPLVMVSSASYPHIDAAHPACFSRTVVGRLLRHQLGFRGIVISDSMEAVAVSHRTPGQRAVGFLRAGGTMLLDTGTGTIPAMMRAVTARMAHHPRFARTVRAAVMTVLTVKAAQHLIVV